MYIYKKMHISLCILLLLYVSVFEEARAEREQRPREINHCQPCQLRTRVYIIYLYLLIDTGCSNSWAFDRDKERDRVRDS